MPPKDTAQNPALSFGEFIRSRRLDIGKTAREVAEAVGMRPSNFCNLEHGALNPPGDGARLVKLADALNLKTQPERRQFFDLAAAAKDTVPVDIAEIISSQDAIPLLLRSVGNRKLTRADLQKIVDIVHGKAD